MKQITEDYVSYEIAKLLKEKGFDEDSWFHFDSDGDVVIRCYRLNHPNEIPAWTHQTVLKWLREVHNIDIIAPPQFDNVEWTYSPIIFKLSIPCTEIRLNDNKHKKELAVEAALLYVLKNLI